MEIEQRLSALETRVSATSTALILIATAAGQFMTKQATEDLSELLRNVAAMQSDPKVQAEASQLADEVQELLLSFCAALSGPVPPGSR